MYEFDVVCFATSKVGKFTIGKTYTLSVHRMNDIEWSTVIDDEGEKRFFHEQSWMRVFNYK